MMATEPSGEPLQENIIPKRYPFLIGIDIGTSTTSVSYALVNNKEDIITIVDWPGINKNEFHGRVPSACRYETIDGLPQIGRFAQRRYYKSGDHFHTSNVKSYLTDHTYLEQHPLPEGLNSIKLLADFIKKIHEHAVEEMKKHFKSKDAETAAVAIADPKDESATKDVTEDSNSRLVEESEIRFVVSYPDNQNGDYKIKMKNAFEMAGIIGPSDPEERLVFITDSEATAYSCTVDEKVNYSKEPYIVCDIGGTVFGISTLKVFELSETGTVEAQIDQSSGECGSIKLDINMRKYLESKISASDEKDLDKLKLVQNRVFDFFDEQIKPVYDDSEGDSFYNMSDIDITNSSIHSDCFEENGFKFSHQDMRDEIFGPVIREIQANIRKVKEENCGNRISGIFISGAIGHGDYLKGIVDEEFGKDGVKVTSLHDSQFAVSKGLVACGFRNRGRMIPYYEGRNDLSKDKVINVDGRMFTDDDKNIDFSGLDYVIGLDFGTTYSGFAFAKAEHCNKSDAKHTSVIQVVKIWPKMSLNHFSKVPSMLYFDSEMNYAGSFGQEAKKKSEVFNSTGILVRHFKLMLAREYDPVLDDAVLNTLSDFQVLDAIVHYLRDFNKAGINMLKRIEDSKGVKVPAKPNVGYVITIPAMWSDEAKNTMRVAVQKAGLVKEEHIRDRVHFITEAEAAAMFCEEFYNDQFSMDNEQRFMICDAGGGTVDLVTFKVSQGDQGQKCISELTSGDGDNFGSIFLDRAFQDYIVEKFNKHNIKSTASGINRLLEHFIHEIKPNFNSEVDAYLEEDFLIDVPIECDLFDVEDTQGFIEDDRIVIPFIDIERYVFTPVVDAVLDLIHNQLKKLQDGEQQLDAILLVGGFGRSSYLLRKIKDRFEGQATGASFIGSPDEGNLAICKGAVSFGLRPRMVSEGKTRYAYGLQVKKKFRETLDNPDQKMKGYGGNDYCQNVFSTIVPKDTSIKKGWVYVQKVFVTYPNDPVFAIYSTEEADPPYLTTELNEYIMKVTVKMPELPHMNNGDRVPFDLYFEITGTDVNVEVSHDDRILEQGVTKTPNIVKTKFTSKKSDKKLPESTRPGLISKITVFLFPEKDA